MKKFAVLSLLLFVSASLAMANNVGFNNTNVQKMSVTDALKMSDNSYVSVEGSILKKLTNDKYLFKDSTGTMTVEIDNDRWAGISADTKDILILNGEIEKKMGSTCLDVDSVQKVARK